jgi:anthranilate synthase/aminodeoxychorismate synthase-like glutamine amidotransferase
MNIVILDNFDSFTFNLLDEFSSPENKIHVWRNTMPIDEAELRLLSLKPPRLLVLSPGPGHPDDAGCMNELIKRMSGKVPIFGVCLGMQAMVSIFGGKVTRASQVVHGKARILEHDGSLIFKGLKNRIHVGRYHSLHASVVPPSLRVFGHSDGLVMALAHQRHPIIGIQFHPESILSTQGSLMIENVIAWSKEHS